MLLERTWFGLFGIVAAYFVCRDCFGWPEFVCLGRHGLLFCCCGVWLSCLYDGAQVLWHDEPESLILAQSERWRHA